ncbi:flagellar hook-length control protein FliK [Tabrizicola sp. KVB23]|uniref:Flagellar hook-length control protein FliK n=1 Tax=Fuscibacter oryzae TaxID=2803939 RepID=A0A8J7SUC8_9RHOB|nr:flagellar hook-length control protein FliK [Fuscibacter oryzae]
MAEATGEIAVETTEKATDEATDNATGEKHSQDQEIPDPADSDAAMAMFMGLPMMPVPLPVKPGEGVAAAELQPEVSKSLTQQGDSHLPHDAAEQMAALTTGASRPPAKASGAATSAPVQGLRQGLPTTAPPDLVAEDATTEAAALPNLTRGAMESAARFRLDAAAEPAADDLAALRTDTSGDVPLSGAPISEPRLEQRQADLALLAPHKQAAGHLTKLLTETGAQLATHANRSELTLAPEELGRIKFDIRQHGDTLVVTLTADRPETLELMRRHASDLRSELAAAGYGGATLDFAGSGGRHPASEQPDTTSAFETFAELAPALPEPQPSPAFQNPVATDGLDLRL